MILADLIEIILIGVAVIAAGLGVLLGYRRRTGRSLVSLGFSGISLVAAFLTTEFAVIPRLRELVPSRITEMTGFDFLPVTSDNAAGMLIYILAAALVGPVIFMLIFLVLRLLLLIPDAILRHRMKKRESEDYRSGAAHRIIGAAAGGLGGLLLVFPLLAASAGHVGMLSVVGEEMDKSGIHLDTAFPPARYLPTQDDCGPFCRAVYSVVSLPMMDTFSRVTFAGEEESVAILWNRVGPHFETFFRLYGDYGHRNEELAIKDVLPLLNAVESIADGFSSDALLRHLAADLLEYISGRMPGISADTMKNLADSLRANDGSFAKLLGSVRNAASIAVRLSSGEADYSAMAEEISWLSENLDEKTVGTVREAASGTLSGMTDEKTAQVLTEAFANLCNKLVKSKDMSAEESLKNAEALVRLYDICTRVAGKQAAEEDVFGTLIPSADEIVQDICRAGLVAEMVQDIAFDNDGNPAENPLGSEIRLSAADAAKLKNAISAYRSAHPDADARTLNAIAHIFNLSNE